MSALVFVKSAERDAAYAQQQTMRKRGVVLRGAEPSLRKRVTNGITENRIVQSPDTYRDLSWFAGIHTPLPIDSTETDYDMELSAAKTAFYFLARNIASDGLSDAIILPLLAAACNDAAYKMSIFSLLTSTYVLDASPFVGTNTFTAPTLHWAHISRTNASVRLFLDNTRRLVVKAYPFTRFARDYLEGIASGNLNKCAPLVDIATDIAVSYYLVALVRDYEHVATPHFAFVVDWFLGPAIAPDGVRFSHAPGSNKATVTDVVFESSGKNVMQYVVAERADMTLHELVGNAGSGALSFTLLRALLFQVFFSLEAAWHLMGYLHYDLHGGNIMVRFLANEPTSPYAHRTWQYKRAHLTDDLYLTLADHANVFVEIIDAGRSRICAPDGLGHTVVVGNAMLGSLGIFAGKRANRSWDVMLLAVQLLLTLDIDALVRNETIGVDGAFEKRSTAAATAKKALVLKEFIVAALGGLDMLDYLVGAHRLRISRRDYYHEEYTHTDSTAYADTFIRTNNAFWTDLVAFVPAMQARKLDPIKISVKEGRAVFAEIYDAIRETLNQWGISADYTETGGDARHFTMPFFYHYLAQSERLNETRQAPISVSSLLDHDYFYKFRAHSVEPANRVSPLLVGHVDKADVLDDPYTQTKPPAPRD